jgi:hypothetical protein
MAFGRQGGPKVRWRAVQRRLGPSLALALFACARAPSSRNPAVVRSTQECTAAAAVDGLPTPGFGVDLTGLAQDQRRIWLEGMHELGLRWVRMDLDSLSRAADEGDLIEEVGRVAETMHVVLRYRAQRPPGDATGAAADDHWARSLSRLASVAQRLRGRVRHFEIAADGFLHPGAIEQGARLYGKFFEEARQAVKQAAPEASVLSAAPASEILEATLRDPEHPGARLFDGLSLPAPGWDLRVLASIAGRALETLCQSGEVVPLWLVSDSPSGMGHRLEPSVAGLENALAIALVRGRGFWRPGANDEGVLAFAATARALASATFVNKEPLGRQGTRYVFASPSGWVDVYRITEGDVAVARPGRTRRDFLGRALTGTGDSLRPPGGWVREGP